MWQLQEEVANLPAESQADISPFAMALQGGPKSQLAKSLKTIFEDISHNGYCYERIHNYIEISFCMPQKVFKRLNPCLEVEPESIWYVPTYQQFIFILLGRISDFSLKLLAFLILIQFHLKVRVILITDWSIDKFQ